MTSWTELMQMIFLMLENLQDRVCDTDLVQNKDAIRIKQMLGYIHAHYAEQLTVFQIASMLRLNVVALLPEDGTLSVHAGYPPASPRANLLAALCRESECTGRG